MLWLNYTNIYFSGNPRSYWMQSWRNGLFWHVFYQIFVKELKCCFRILFPRISKLQMTNKKTNIFYTSKIVCQKRSHMKKFFTAGFGAILKLHWNKLWCKKLSISIPLSRWPKCALKENRPFHKLRYILRIYHISRNCVPSLSDFIC